jgi:hypothetical protein
MLKAIGNLIGWALVIGMIPMCILFIIMIIIAPEKLDWQSRLSGMIATFATIYFWIYTLNK